MTEPNFSNVYNSFQRRFEIAPIYLEGGIAQNLPYGYASILQWTEGSESVVYPDPNDYFARFKVVSGGELQNWGIADYPFASMAMAANAVLKNPLHVSVMMYCPAQASPAAKNYRNNYISKQGTITSLKFTLDDHISKGGTFTVDTPAFTYTNCLLTSLKDVSVATEKQVQYIWQWDFTCPLITQAQTEAVYNTLYQKISQGLPVSTDGGQINQSGTDVVTNPANQTVPSNP